MRFINLIEITNDFVQETQTLQALFVDIRLIVELLIIGYGGKHDRDTGITLVIQLRGPFQMQKMCGNVSWQNVLQ